MYTALIAPIINAIIAFLESHEGATLDQAIAALKKAKDKSLDEYIRLDAEAQKLKPPQLPP